MIGRNFKRYANFGVEIDDEGIELAKEVIVLLILCIKGTWKLHFGYLLTSGLNEERKWSISLVIKTGC